MSLSVYQETEKEIDLAYKEQNMIKIEKETMYILSLLIVVMSSLFKDRLNKIYIDIYDIDYNKEFISSEENRKALFKWLDRIIHMEQPIDDYEFGKLKVDFEEWFYNIGGKEIVFDYRRSYLMKPSDVARELGVSTVTLNKYVKRGFEYIDHPSHNRIPKHMIPLWKDPVYAVKVQMLYQKKKLKMQEPEERLKELFEEILEFQKKYKAESYLDLVNAVKTGEIEDIADFYEWQSLEEEKKSLMLKILGGNDLG